MPLLKWQLVKQLVTWSNDTFGNMRPINPINEIEPAATAADDNITAIKNNIKRSLLNLHLDLVQYYHPYE